MFFTTFTACGLDYRYQLDENLHNTIECFREYIFYQGERYIFVGTINAFSVVVDDNCIPYKDDVLLSWNGYRYIWYIDEYYSYSPNKPVFIYENRMHFVYFHEDYNYFADIFELKGTNEEIALGDIFDYKDNNCDFEETFDVDLVSKKYPRIRIHVELDCINQKWYISLPDSDDVWVASDKFIEIIYQNGLIYNQ